MKVSRAQRQLPRLVVTTWMRGSDVSERNCVECSTPLSGRQTKFCSTPCQSIGYHRTRPQRDRSAAARQGEYVEHICTVCGSSWQSMNRDRKYCSPRCKGDAYREQARQRRLPVPHPDPDLVTHLPSKHPARRPAARRTDWWTVVACGSCEWCGSQFAALTSSVGERLPRYCSQRCSTTAGKARRGHFAIPPALRLWIYERDALTCQLCGDPVDCSLGPADAWGPTLDHIICRSWTDDSDDSPENLRLAHRWCNSVRADERFVSAAELAAP